MVEYIKGILMFSLALAAAIVILVIAFHIAGYLIYLFEKIIDVFKSNH